MSVPSRLPFFPHLTASVQAFNRLQEWPSVIDTFRVAVNRKASLAPQTEIPDGSSRLLILMRLLLRSEVKSQYVNIENNFLYAALHV